MKISLLHIDLSTQALFKVLCVAFIALQPQFIVAQGPINTCNDNTYIFSDDPNTIEYDNMVSTYHSTIMKEVDGRVQAWGENAKADGDHQLIPIDITPANGYDYDGQILKITAASKRSQRAQFVILTTEGLYAWGDEGRLLHASIKSGNAFGKVSPTETANQTGSNNYSLPMGVEPLDVKMMFGSYRTIGIVTNSGAAWIMSRTASIYGDGYSGSDGVYIWHRIHKSSTPGDTLDNVVTMRGHGLAMMAQTADGKIYTWGDRVYLGDGNNH